MAGTSLDLPFDGTGFRSGSVRRELLIGPLPLFQFAGSLKSLLRYPYGCLEQTVSRAMPLIYLGDLAARLDPELLDPAKTGFRPSDQIANFVADHTNALEISVANHWSEQSAFERDSEAEVDPSEIPNRVADKRSIDFWDAA